MLLSVSLMIAIQVGKLISYCGFDFLFLIDSVSVGFVFLGICLFHLCYLICLHIIIHNFPYSPFSLRLIIMFTVSLLILVILSLL